MIVLPLSVQDLSLAAALALALAVLTIRMRLGLAMQLVVAAARTTIQLLLVGMGRKVLFDSLHPGYMAVVAVIMISVAGREVMGRQKSRFSGWWGFGVETLSMAVAGWVSLPGMMTGQILGGSPPEVAVRYQILIMFTIAAGTGFGTIAAVWLGSTRLFNTRQRLRLDRLR